MASIAGSRTATANGPTVSSSDDETTPTAVASANASKVAISPSHSSR